MKVEEPKLENRFISVSFSNIFIYILLISLHRIYALSELYRLPLIKSKQHEICLISFKKGVDDVIFGYSYVNVLGFKVGNQDNSSIINFGPNQFIDQFTSYKRNQGVGDPGGDLSPINMPISWVVDPDLSDSFTSKNSLV